MIHKILIACLLMMLVGCGTLASPKASIGCQMADVATTAVAINAGAHEANPVMGGVLKAFGWPGFVLAKLGVGLLLAHAGKQAPTPVAAANVGTCAVAAHNLLVR